jgi:hypothetical protein
MLVGVQSLPTEVLIDPFGYAGKAKSIMSSHGCALVPYLLRKKKGSIVMEESSKERSLYL